MRVRRAHAQGANLCLARNDNTRRQRRLGLDVDGIRHADFQFQLTPIVIEEEISRLMLRALLPQGHHLAGLRRHGERIEILSLIRWAITEVPDAVLILPFVHVAGLHGR